MDESDIDHRINSNAKAIAALSDDIRELGQLLKSTLAGVEKLTEVKTGTMQEIADLEQEVKQLGESTANNTALLQEIRAQLNLLNDT